MSALTKERARALSKAWDGVWNDEKARSRGAACPICGCIEVSITAKPRGVMLCCNGCGAGKASDDNRLVQAAAAAGFECGPGVARPRNLSGPRPLPKASEASIEDLKHAQRRVLAFCAKQAAANEWFEISQRSIVRECGGSKRDAIPVLQRLAARGLIRVQSNNYKLKRRTKIAFLVDPSDLARRIGTTQARMVSPPPKMVSP